MVDVFFSNRDWEGLYLTGGTCLAEFYFGHRLSIDIDLFTHNQILFSSARQLLMQEDFFPFGKLQPRRSFPELSQFLLVRPNQDPIKIDLVLDIPRRLENPVKFENIWLDNLMDITSNKVGCIIQRNEIKDYLDLFYLIPTLDLSARQLIELGQKKDASVDPLILAHQIQFIKTVKSSPPYLLANVPWKQIQGFFEHLHDQVLDELAHDTKPT